MAKAKKSVFDTAEKIPTIKKTDKSPDRVVHFPAPLNVLVNLKILEKHIEDATKNLEAQIKNGPAFDFFHEEMKRELKQPDSFTATCDNTQIQFQYSKPSHGFKESIKEILDKHGIEYETNTKIEERFVFNPKIFENTKLMKKIDAALTKIQEEENITILQKQEAVNSYQFTDNTIRQIIEKITDPMEQAEILKDKALATIKAAKPMIDNQDHKSRQAVNQALANLIEMDLIQYSKEK